MLPEKFIERMKSDLGEECDSFLESLDGDRYQALRINAIKGQNFQNQVEDTLKGTLEKCSQFFHLSPVPWAENGFYYEAEDTPGKHPYHEAGVYYIQEPSAMAPAGLLEVQPGDHVLDLCAAPGGKSTQLGAAMKGQGLLVCNEINPSRAKILSENVERMGIVNALVTNETADRLAAVFPDYFDKILVDAPCSGEGMFRKNEEAGKEWSPENVDMCAERQDEILDCAAAMLRRGGRLVYSTCTFAIAEDEGSIARFLMRHPEFHVIRVENQIPEGTILMPGKIESTKKIENASKNIQRNFQDSMEGTDKTDKRDEAEENENGKEQIHRETKDTLSGEIALSQELQAQLQNTIRLWPHRLKGEGHYAAVLEKDGDTTPGYHALSLNGLEKGISQKEYADYLSFEKENLKIHLTGKFYKFGDQLYLMPEEMPSLKGLKVLRPGLHLGTLKKNRFEPSHALALALNADQVVHSLPLKAESNEIREYLKGQTLNISDIEGAQKGGEKGWYLVCVDGFGTGWGKLAGGILKNHYPKGLRK